MYPNDDKLFILATSESSKGSEAVVANFFDNVRPSNVMVQHKFELTTDQPILQKFRRVPLCTARLSRRKCIACLMRGLLPVSNLYRPKL